MQPLPVVDGAATERTAKRRRPADAGQQQSQQKVAHATPSARAAAAASYGASERCEWSPMCDMQRPDHIPDDTAFCPSCPHARVLVSK